MPFNTNAYWSFFYIGYDYKPSYGYSYGGYGYEKPSYGGYKKESEYGHKEESYDHKPKYEEYKPEPYGYKPKYEEYKPEPYGYKPKYEEYKPEPYGYKPNPYGYKPEPYGYRPKYGYGYIPKYGYKPKYEEPKYEKKDEYVSIILIHTVCSIFKNGFKVYCLNEIFIFGYFFSRNPKLKTPNLMDGKNKEYSTIIQKLLIFLLWTWIFLMACGISIFQIHFYNVEIIWNINEHYFINKLVKIGLSLKINKQPKTIYYLKAEELQISSIK